VLDSWRERGYKIALLRDVGRAEPLRGKYGADSLLLERDYPGYGGSVNLLAKTVLKLDPSCDWIVTGGDDTLPDPTYTADEIAAQCSEYFGTTPRKSTISIANGTGTVHLDRVYETFGVMQPTGDRFADGSIDRIAGSPWIGREFCLRVNQGNGPLWAEYWHMFDDEELQNVAIKLGVFWQRADLIHLHRHFMRESDAIDSPAVRKDIPPHLIRANSKEHWDKNQKLFRARKAAGFPGHEPL